MEVTGLDQIPVACRPRNVAQASPVVPMRSGRDFSASRCRAFDSSPITLSEPFVAWVCLCPRLHHVMYAAELAQFELGWVSSQVSRR